MSWLRRALYFVVSSEGGGLGGGVEVIYFGDLSSSSLSGMLWFGGRIDRRDEGNTSEEKVLLGGQNEGEVPMDAVARVGGDGGCVTIELGLGNVYGVIGRLTGSGGGKEVRSGVGKEAVMVEVV
jgi:hypothetical protein